MARKARKIQDASSDDDAPEAVSHSASKADAKRSQRILHDFEREEKARRKTRNRERDRKLKERARVTRGGNAGGKAKGIRFMDQQLEDEDESDDSDRDGMEARMLRAMRDAADEAESDEGEEDDEKEDEFKGFGQGSEDMASGSDSPSVQDDDEMDLEAPTEDEEIDEDEQDESLQPQANIHRSSRKVDYLPDDLFAAAFAPQNSKQPTKKNAESTQQQTVRKRRRKSGARPKDLVVGGRTIRTLPRLSDPRSQATERSVPSARARKFVNQSLAMKGKQALLKAKKRGWERRAANVGVMKYQGAPHGFIRNAR